MLTPEHREKIARELDVMEGDADHPAHAEFLEAYEVIRRRQLLEPSAADVPPSAAKAVEEAIAVVRKTHPGFQPDVPAYLDELAKPGAAATSRQVAEPHPLVQRMLSALYDIDQADATDVKWELVPDDRKQEMRADFQRSYDSGRSVRSLAVEFKRQVDALEEVREYRQERDERKRASG